jgi:hypothetical protein
MVRKLILNSVPASRLLILILKYRVNYVKLMRAIETDEGCPKCYAPYSIETLSVKRFVDDISAWNKDKTRLIG